jgi:hypothetical protein
VLTATLPKSVRDVLKASGLFDSVVVVGEDCADDERLRLRETHAVNVRFLEDQGNQERHRQTA